MKEYVENMKEYVENLKEYEEICQYIGCDTLISIWTSGLRKNSEFSPFIWVMGLGKIPRPRFLLGSGTWKNIDLHPYTFTYTEIGSGTWRNSELCLHTGSGI